MNRDEIIEFEPIIDGPGKIKEVLSDEKYKPVLNDLYFGLGLVNITDVFTFTPDPIYGGSRTNLEEEHPLLYFQTHVSS